MGMFDKYPYTDFHELNLDWLIKTVRDMEYKMDDGFKKYIREAIDSLFIDVMYNETTETLIIREEVTVNA